MPAKQDPLTCAKLAFAALPQSISQRYFRGDSACHENQLLQWLKHSDREREPGGRIGFAVSAVMSEALAEALRKVPETDWKSFGKEDDGTLRQRAEGERRLGVAWESLREKHPNASISTGLASLREGDTLDVLLERAGGALHRAPHAE